MIPLPHDERAANARFAAQYIFEAAVSGNDGHMARARQAVLDLADHVAFAEMIVGEMALCGLARRGAPASEYFAAEIAARRALQRFVPQLAGLADLQWGYA